jgi:hypothetical protein
MTDISDQQAIEAAERTGIRMTGLLLIISAMSVVGLWTLDTSDVAGESVFAVYLSMNLISFAMIAYVYRVTKNGDNISRLAMIAGCAMLVVLIFAGFSVWG